MIATSSQIDQITNQISNRIQDMMSRRPTWSRSPVGEFELCQSISQVVHEELTNYCEQQHMKVASLSDSSDNIHSPLEKQSDI